MSDHGHDVPTDDCVVRGACHHPFDPHTDNPVTPLFLSLFETTSLISTMDAEPVCQIAIEQVKAEVTQTSQQTPPGTSIIAVSPDVDHMVWHHAREEFQAKSLFNKDTAIKGAVDPATGCALIWCRVWREGENDGIDVLKTVIPGIVDDPSEGVLSSRTWSSTSSQSATDSAEHSIGAYRIRQSLAALLLRAQLESAIWKMQGGVEIWSPEGVVIAAVKVLNKNEDVKIVVREEEHICSLRWESEGEVEWLANEKYAWC